MSNNDFNSNAVYIDDKTVKSSQDSLVKLKQLLLLLVNPIECFAKQCYAKPNLYDDDRASTGNMILHWRTSLRLKSFA